MSEPRPTQEAAPAGPFPEPARVVSRAWRPRAGAFLVLASVLAVFFAPAIFSAEQFLFRDNGRMHWPMKQYLAERLRHGDLPEWNPYLSLGAPLISGAIDAVQHPFSLLLVVLPFSAAFKAWVLLSFLIAATGACAWARRLGRSWPASVAAGLGFALSGSLVGASDNLTYVTTLATIPWLLAAAHRWLDQPGPGSLALLGLASYLCAAGGDPQAWGFAVLLLIVYPLALPRPARPRWRDLLRGPQAAGVAVIGAAPIILPVLGWLAESSRSGALDLAELARWNLPAARLAEFALPFMYRDGAGTVRSLLYSSYGGMPETGTPWVASIYLGATLLALALLAAVRTRPARWLLAAGAVFAWMAMGHGTWVGRLLLSLPVLSGFRYWEKMAVWPSLLIPLAAAFAIDLVVERRAERAAATAVAGAGLLLLVAQGLGRAWPGPLLAKLAVPGASPTVVETLAGNLLDGALHAGLVSLVLGVALLAVQAGVVRRAAGPLLAAVVIADVFGANVRGYQLTDPITVRPRSPFGPILQAQPGLQRILTPPFTLDLDRFAGVRQFEADWLQIGLLLQPCFNLDYRVGNVLPYTGMVPARADRYRRRQRATQQVPPVGLFGVGWLAVALTPAAAADVGARPPLHVVATDPALPAYLLRIPHRERTYLAQELSSIDRRGAMEFALSFDPDTSTASVVEGPVPAGYHPPAGSARIVGDDPEHVSVATEADGPALLVLNDIFAKGWTATVDDRPASILPTNYLARGVWVEEGSHRVDFRYRTPLLREGWALFSVAAAALAFAAALRARRRRQEG